MSPRGLAVIVVVSIHVVILVGVLAVVWFFRDRP